MTPLQETSGATRGPRRVVRLQRSYVCPGCEGEHNSWARLGTCPDCGHTLSVAVIKRAVLAG